MKQGPLEMRSEVEVQYLSLVQVILEERIGDIDANEPEGRFPRHADARRGARVEVCNDARGIGNDDLAVGQRNRVVVELDAAHRTEIGEAEGLDAVFLRQAERNA